MKVHLFEAETRLEAWLEATEFLLEEGRTLNVILSIDSPGAGDPGGMVVRDTLDAFYRAESELPLHTVAETIFPAWAYRRRGILGLKNHYASEYARIKQPQHWGTYADRMLRRTDPDGSPYSPLLQLIEKMKSERSKRAPKRACYELGVALPGYELALYDTTADRTRRMGLPCLSHVSFKLFDDAVHLAAQYRSHDYRYKVPGNLLGLARLQQCVANEVGVRVGGLVVHSTYAWANGPKGTLRDLLRDVRTAMP